MSQELRHVRNRRLASVDHSPGLRARGCGDAALGTTARTTSERRGVTTCHLVANRALAASL